MSYTGKRIPTARLSSLAEPGCSSEQGKNRSEFSATQHFSLNIGQSLKKTQLFVVLKEAFKADVLELSRPFPGRGHSS